VAKASCGVHRVCAVEYVQLLFARALSCFLRSLIFIWQKYSKEHLSRTLTPRAYPFPHCHPQSLKWRLPLISATSRHKYANR
jgi:hypothetical protein